MKLGEKLRYLREVEGVLRGLDRAMTQQEAVRAIKKDLKNDISQSYLSQIESGARPHLTNTSRMLLARLKCVARQRGSRSSSKSSPPA